MVGGKKKREHNVREPLATNRIVHARNPTHMHAHIQHRDCGHVKRDTQTQQECNGGHRERVEGEE